jgi:4-hydroxy-3-polyprenylbenzoate decarboxylase/2,5-furandicarboxylate decarboxylase 1
VRPKWVIVVEPDIDIHNPSDVEWAMALRVRPERDVFVIADLPAGPADPSVDSRGPPSTPLSSAVGIDATRPAGVTFPDVADVPGWREFSMPELAR